MRGRHRDLEQRITELETALGSTPQGSRFSKWGQLLIVGLLAGWPAAVPQLMSGPDPSACDIQVQSVSRALETGLDDPANLKALAIGGCGRTPEQMAEDMQD